MTPILSARATLAACLLAGSGVSVQAAGDDVNGLRQAALMVRTYAAVVSRVETLCTPPEGTSTLVTDWRSRNRRYTAAADLVIEDQFSDQQPNKAQAASDKVNTFAARLADELFVRRTKDDKAAGCAELQSEILEGEFDLRTQLKVARQLEALLHWAEQSHRNP